MGERFLSYLKKVTLLVIYPFLFQVNYISAADLPVRVAGTTYMMPINKPPVIAPDTFIVNEFGGICDAHQVDRNNARCNYEIDVLANDSDIEGDSLTLASTSVAQSGTVIISGNKAIYSPTISFFINGTDSFYYDAMDSEGNVTQGTVSLVLNRAPIVNSDGFNIPIINAGAPEGYICNATQVDPQCSFVFDPVANDPVDPDGDEITQIITTRNKFFNGFHDLLIYDPANGVDYVTADDKKIDFLVDTTCLFGGVPPEGCDFGKVGTADSAYRLVDARGAISKIGWVAYAANNNPPNANTDSGYQVAPGNSILINVLANDSDDDGHTFTLNRISEAPLVGTASIVSNQVEYTAPTNFVGPVQFKYEIKDSLNGLGTGTVLLAVVEPNSAPIANNDSAQTNANETVSIDVLANDSDPDIGQTIRIVDVPILPMHGQASIINGQINYTPDANYYGTDEFIYRIQDSEGAYASANVTVQILAAPTVVPTSPVEGNNYLTTESITATATANDLDGTISLVKFKLNTDANWQQTASSPYSHNYDQLPAGDYNIQYQAVDNSGNSSAIKTVSFQVFTPVTVDASWGTDPVVIGQDVVFTWNSTGATGCSSPTQSFVSATSGAVTTQLLEVGTTSATVTCTNTTTNETGDASATTTVIKLSAPSNLQSQQQ